MPGCAASPATLGTAEGCAAFVAAEPKADILVNNLGIFELKDFFDIEDAEWSRFFEVNVMSGCAWPAPTSRNGRARLGRVVFLSSESALNIPADDPPLQQDRQPLGVARPGQAPGRHRVTVNAVLPGPTLTEGVAEMLREDAQKAGQSIEEAGTAFVRQHRSSSIIQRLATPEEVANLVVYACSTQARRPPARPCGSTAGARQPGLTSAQRQRKMLPGTAARYPAALAGCRAGAWRRRS